MGELSYSITITLLHSIWQTALLWLFYKAAVAALKNTHPTAKRNAVLTLLLSQIFLSSITFVLTFTGISPVSENIFPAADYLTLQDYWLKNYSAYFLFLYGCIVIFRCMKMLGNWQDFRNLQTSQHLKAPADMRVFTRLKAAELGIRRNVGIWLSPHAISPLTFGFLKPVILLPAALVNQLSLEQAETLILHELSHIKNNDYLLNWLLLVAETIFFFNPFILLAINEIRKQRELACDVSVMEYAYGPIPYAEALLKTAQLHAVVSRFQLAAFQNKDLLLKRILFFTSEKHENLQHNNLLNAALIPLSFVILLGWMLMGSAGPATPVEKGTLSRKLLLFPPAAMAAFTETNVALSTNDFAKLSPAKQKTAPATTLIAVQPETMNITASSDYNTEEDVQEQAISLLPVAYEAAADSVREVIVTEENSAGNSVTRSYKVNFKNGRWNITLLWLTVDKKSPDSLIINSKDSSTAAD